MIQTHLKDSRFIRITSVFAIIFFSSCCFMTALRLSTLPEQQRTQPNDIYKWNYGYIIFGTWRIAQTLTYIVFISRLKNVFNESQYEQKSYAYNILYIISTVWLLIEGMKDLNYYFTNNDEASKDVVNGIELLASIMIEAVILFSIFYLSVKKLFRLNLDIRLYSKVISRSQRNLKVVVFINDRLIKYTILSIVEGIGSMSLKILFLINYFKDKSNITMSCIWIIYWSLYCVLNSLCIFWCFDFTQFFYFCCCICCHKCCINCCSKISKNTVKRLSMERKLIANELNDQ